MDTVKPGGISPVSAVATPEDLVDHTELLATLETLPLPEHAAVLESVHTQLLEVLTQAQIGNS